MITTKLTLLFMVAVGSCVQRDSLTGKRFYIGNNNRRWNEARTICEDIGGRLAQIDNQQTLDGLLAYAKTNRWKDVMTSHFWIGLNRDPKSNTLRWDHCESVDASSFTFWEDSSQDQTKLCVYAEKDTLEWFSEVCDSSSYQYLCQEDTGPCTYTEFNGTCLGSGHDETSVVADVDVAECEDLCSNTLQNGLACWMYSYDSPICILYFDKDPWACTEPSTASVVKTRVCFTFQKLASSSTYTSSEKKPIINCDLYTTQTAATSTPTTTAPTTTVATTTTTAPFVDISIATNTSTRDTILPEVTKSSENTTPVSTNTEATNTPGPTNTSNSDSITASTTSHTTIETTMSPATDPYIPTSTRLTKTTHAADPGTVGTTTATNPTTSAQASMTMVTDLTSPATIYITMTTNPTITPSIAMETGPTSLFTSITMTTDSIIPATTSITMATYSTSPTAVSITMETTATCPESRLTGTLHPTTAEAPMSTAIGTAPSTAQVVTPTPTATSQTTTFSTTTMTTFAGGSSGSRDICPCLVCVETKSMIETQRFVDAILLLLKLDKSKLSATRRKLKSEPDDRPSAQALGYSGIIFIVITFSFFVLNDLMRFCQLWSVKNSNTQMQVRNKTV